MSLLSEFSFFSQFIVRNTLKNTQHYPDTILHNHSMQTSFHICAAMYAPQPPISGLKTRIFVECIEDTRFLGDTSFEEPISELETHIYAECIRDTSFIHSVSTNQIRLLERGDGQISLAWQQICLKHIGQR